MSILMDFLEEQVGKSKKQQSAGDWLETTLKDADKCVWCTNSGRYTHSSADKNAAVLVPYHPNIKDDSVHTANVICERDIAAGANYLSTSRLLALHLEDGRSIFQHFKDDSEQLRREFSKLGADYGQLRALALRAKEGALPTDTDARIRQVFFPLNEGGYHLLSILPPSSLMKTLLLRIQTMDENAAEVNSPKSSRYGKKYYKLLDLIHYYVGGTKKPNLPTPGWNNISYLNFLHTGEIVGLPSLPPKIVRRDVVRPRKDFLSNSLKTSRFKDLFKTLHICYMRRQKNQATRNAARRAEECIIDDILGIAYKLQTSPAGWSDAKGYTLPMTQKIWLDEKYSVERMKEKGWKRIISDAIARWIVQTYKKTMKDEAVPLGDAETENLQQEAMDALQAFGGD